MSATEYDLVAALNRATEALLDARQAVKDARLTLGYRLDREGHREMGHLVSARSNAELARNEARNALFRYRNNIKIGV